MSLNLSTGNMYEFINATWNTIKGQCYHDCSYCYMKRWGKLKPVRFDSKELKTDLSEGNFIFVGSSCDMWAWDIPDEWIWKTINHCENYNNNYFFQSKNPERFHSFDLKFTANYCTTIETNRWYKDIMGKSPLPEHRSYYMPLNQFVTIEPILDFDLKDFIKLIKTCQPSQVNIGSDSGNHKLPEPSKDKLLELIYELEKFTVIHSKKNLNRLLR